LGGYNGGSTHDAGWSSPVAREAHNLEVAGSNPVPATETPRLRQRDRGVFCCAVRETRVGPTHAEYFGIFSVGKEEPSDQNYASFGIHYLVTKDIEIGDRFGFGLTDESARFFK
jgi:hypothetical protein